MQGILASADALRCRHEEDALSHQLLAMIQRECGRIDQMLSDLLNLARPVRIDRNQPQSLTRIAEETIRDFQQRNAPAVRIVTEIAPRLPFVCVDAEGIRCAIQALLQNALESMPVDQQIRFIVEDQTDHIRIRIEDNGEGILPEHFDRVTVPFFSTRPQKAGLGLTIAERILQLHEGTLRIESVRGKGTSILLQIPVRA